MSRFSIGPQGGQAIGSPSYVINKYQGVYTRVMLNAGPVNFQRVMGPQRIVMNLFDGTNTYIWSFAITGGTNKPVTNALPMFPNTASTYDPSINFILDPAGIVPLGCTVVTQPIPLAKTSSRINIFNVTETTSGLGYAFQLSLCPFLNITTTIQTIGHALPVGSVLTVYSEFFRVHPDLRTNGTPISFMAPTYATRTYETLINPILGISPLDNPATKVPFNRFSGQQTIVFVNHSTGYYFTIDVDYGVIGQGNGYLGYVSPTANGVLVSGSTPVGCSVENIFVSGANSNAVMRMTRLEVISDVSDGGGRTYLIDLFPATYGKTTPLISRSAGAPIGNEVIGVQIYCRYFSSV
jgi:hypothetical protein